MNKSIWQRVQPHVLAIGVFLLVSAFYCLPALQGLIVNQSDIIGWKGMAQQSIEFKEKHGHFPLWTNSLFSGMPAYQVYLEAKYNISIAWLDSVFRGFLPNPAGFFFLNCIGFYILCVVVRLRTWVAIFGALAYAFASYNPILIATGHITKLAAMGYSPAVLAGLLLLTQRKYVLGFITTLLFATLLFFQNHIQIVYYTILIALCASVAFAIQAIRKKEIKHLLVTGGLALVAAGISAASYAVMLMPLNEYVKETMRGGRSELTINNAKENKSKGGLDKDYAFSWSYGIGESMTFILPAARGGSSGPGELPSENSKSVEAMQDSQLPEEAINYFYRYLNAYWGDQPSTSGPVYFGVIVMLLAIAGLFIVRSWHLGWIIAVSLLGILLSWGKNFSSFNYFLFDYLPMYNKFRAPSMSLVIPQLSFALLAAFALQELLYGNWDPKTLWKKLKSATIVTGLLLVIMIFGYFNSDYKSERDKDVKGLISQTMERVISQGKQPTDQISQQANTIASSIMTGLTTDRKNLYSSDLVRSLLFFALGFVLIFLAYRKKFKPLYLAVGFILISFIDLIGVDLRYLSKSNYIAEDELLGTTFTPNRADLQIKQDTGYYRVFDQNGDFQDNSRSAYHHNSIGGYNPAKLALYQDLIEHQLSKNNMQVMNMLNTKYFIVSGQQDQQPMAIPNPEALGPVWFVKAIRFVNNADEEMKALDSIAPKDTAIADKREQSKIPIMPQFDSTASIRLVQNLNDQILYESKSTSNQFAVFSEIYYPYGWKAFVDGKETPIARVNYVLRGLPVPAGDHKIEFRFEPKSKANGDMISLVISILSWILLIGGLIWEWKQSNKTTVKAKA
jgi:hypothetical protein